MRPFFRAVAATALLAAWIAPAWAREVELRYPFAPYGEPVQMQAVWFPPAARGKAPGVVLVHGHNGDAWTVAPLGRFLAEHGYAALAVSMLGYGKSPGDNKFVGPDAVAGVGAGLDYLKARPEVDPARVGVWGYSRGAMAAAMLATRRQDLRAVALQSGAYDVKRAYQGLKQAWIRENIEEEMGTSDAAFRERSALFHVGKITAPVLIMHGLLDDRIPVEQARLLEAALRQQGKVVEAEYYRYDHDLPFYGTMNRVLAFLDKHLRPLRATPRPSPKPTPKATPRVPPSPAPTASPSPAPSPAASPTPQASPA